MTKEAVLSVKGLQFEGTEDENNIETITQATYYKKGDSHYILYEEVLEGIEGVSRNRIKCKENLFEMTRKGSVNVQLSFEQGKKTLTSYNTPFGNLMIGLDTKKIDVTEMDDLLKIHIEYAMDINYAYLTDGNIDICLKASK